MLSKELKEKVKDILDNERKEVDTLIKDFKMYAFNEYEFNFVEAISGAEKDIEKAHKIMKTLVSKINNFDIIRVLKQDNYWDAFQTEPPTPDEWKEIQSMEDKQKQGMAGTFNQLLVELNVFLKESEQRKNEKKKKKWWRKK